ncbi:MAG: Pyrrolo-quinoline quinone [Opitutus sp.]|nr:Pyrrolo-quinoline quinone [Opitutus sp.]
MLAAGAWFTALAGDGQSENWPRWRGPRDNGSTESGRYPVKWSGTENLLWKTELPGKGCSTPIVWQQKIYVTAPVQGEDALLAFDWAGKKLWQTTVGAEKSGKHRNGSGSNPSPTTDGTSLFAYYKSGNLAAFDFAGKILWRTNLVEKFGKDTLYWDYGISPVLTERLVVVTVMHQGESWLAGWDKRTGELRWKVPRNYKTPVENDHSYATPIVTRHQGAEQLLVWGAEHLTAHTATTGATLWSAGDFNPGGQQNWVAVSSPVLAGDTVVVPYGRGSRLHGIKLGGTGDVTSTHRAWKREDTGTFVPTPAEYKGKVYLVRDRGEVECIDPVTGKTEWSGQLPKSGSSYYSSPTIADGKVYAAREDGVVFVARVDGKFELLSENHMGERIIAAPVPVGNRLLLRGEKTLFCIAAP